MPPEQQGPLPGEADLAGGATPGTYGGPNEPQPEPEQPPNPDASPDGIVRTTADKATNPVTNAQERIDKMGGASAYAEYAKAVKDYVDRMGGDSSGIPLTAEDYEAQFQQNGEVIDFEVLKLEAANHAPKELRKVYLEDGIDAYKYALGKYLAEQRGEQPTPIQPKLREAPPGKYVLPKTLGGVTQDTWGMFNERWSEFVDGGKFVGTEQDYQQYKAEYDALSSTPLSVYAFDGSVVDIPLDEYNQLSTLVGREQFTKMLELGLIPEGSQYVESGDSWTFLTPLQVEQQNKIDSAMSSLESYRTQDGYDIARYLRNNPNGEGPLTTMGFTAQDIQQAKDYNKAAYGIGAREYVERDAYVRQYFADRGWPIIQPGFDVPVAMQKEYEARLAEAIGEHHKEFSPIVPMDVFMENYFETQGWEDKPSTFDYGRTNTKEQLAHDNHLYFAAEAYRKLYGTEAVAGTAAGNVGALAFAPFEMFKPEVKPEDITPLTWGVGAAQLALLAVPVARAAGQAALEAGEATKPIFGAATNPIFRGVEIASAGVFVADTVDNWDEMTPEQRAIAIAIDTAIIAGAINTKGLAKKTLKAIADDNLRVMEMQANILNRQARTVGIDEAAIKAINAVKASFNYLSSEQRAILASQVESSMLPASNRVIAAQSRAVTEALGVVAQTMRKGKVGPFTKAVQSLKRAAYKLPAPLSKVFLSKADAMLANPHDYLAMMADANPAKVQQATNRLANNVDYVRLFGKGGVDLKGESLVTTSPYLSKAKGATDRTLGNMARLVVRNKTEWIPLLGREDIAARLKKLNGKPWGVVSSELKSIKLEAQNLSDELSQSDFFSGALKRGDISWRMPTFEEEAAERLYIRRLEKLIDRMPGYRRTNLSKALERGGQERIDAIKEMFDYLEERFGKQEVENWLKTGSWDGETLATEISKQADDIGERIKEGLDAKTDLEQLLDDIDNLLKENEGKPPKEPFNEPKGGRGGVAVKERTEVKPETKTRTVTETKTATETTTETKGMPGIREKVYSSPNPVEASTDAIGQVLPGVGLQMAMASPIIAPNTVASPTQNPEERPNPAPMIAPQNQPAPQPNANPNPAPQPQPNPSPEPQPQPQPQPAPEPTPSPEPRPYPKPKPIPVPTPKPFPKYVWNWKKPIKIRGKKGGMVQEIPQGSITWAKGIFWRVIPPPYTMAKPITLPMGVTPVGSVNSGGTKPSETVQMIGESGADVPKSISVDDGIVDVFVGDGGKSISFGPHGERTDVGDSLRSPYVGMTIGGSSSRKRKPKKHDKPIRSVRGMRG